MCRPCSTSGTSGRRTAARGPVVRARPPSDVSNASCCGAPMPSRPSPLHGVTGCARVTAPQRTKPFEVLRNGFEPDDFSGPSAVREPGVFRIVHTGTIDPVRHDLAPFFRAVDDVRNRGGFGNLRPEVVLAGKGSKEAVATAREAGVDDLVRALGFVDHDRAVELARTATVNLLMTWAVPGVVADGHLPGKMYEQMGAGRPVMALALPGGEIHDLLERAGGTLVAEPGDQARIGDCLERFATAEAVGDAARAAPPRAIDASPFFRSSVAAQLAGLLASLVP